MRIITARVPWVAPLARLSELSRMARQRLKWMDYYQAHGRNAALRCRHFGISRQTFYRWRGRYDPYWLNTLEERSHRPRYLRQPTWSRELVLRVLHLREQYPRWGKDKLVILLRRKEWQLSTSIVGRILSSLKRRGVLREPQRTHTEEFYEVTEFSLEVAALNQELQAWERTYNTVRPHQAPGYLTPHQFVTRWQHQRKEVKCH